MSDERPQLTIRRGVLDAIEASVGSLPAETGCILGVDAVSGAIVDVAFDVTALGGPVSYSPDVEALNRVIEDRWGSGKIVYGGSAHSHPPALREPSAGDLGYVANILAAMPSLSQLIVGIVISRADAAAFELRVWVATRGERLLPVLREATLLIEEERAAPAVFSGEAFARLDGAVDLDHLARSRVTIVGVGGAASFAEQLARCGVGAFVLIDPDVVELPNLATQNCYLSDVGRPKVACVADRIRDINPAAVVITHHGRLETLSDEQFGFLATETLGGSEPAATLLCACTDNHEAQARCNRLALHLGMPSIAAQLYQGGRGAELVFTLPGLTRACSRCALWSRYQAYANGFENSGGSIGSTIQATERLNALKGQISLALLHRQADGAHAEPGVTRLLGILDHIADRNLALIRLDPDIDELGLSQFEEAFAGADSDQIIFDETIWRRPAPIGADVDGGPCPDCGGRGDLRGAVGRFENTADPSFSQPADEPSPSASGVPMVEKADGEVENRQPEPSAMSAGIEATAGDTYRRASPSSIAPHASSVLWGQGLWGAAGNLIDRSARGAGRRLVQRRRVGTLVRRLSGRN